MLDRIPVRVRLRWGRVLLRLRRAMPWISLALGIAGALIMNRGAEHVIRLMVAASASWVILVTLLLLHRLEIEHLPQQRAMALKVLRFSSLTVTQWLIQLTLLFSLPFYFHAAAGTFWHITFLVALVAMTAISLWDPLCQALLVHPLAGLPLQAFASFVGLNVALPILGLSNRTSLWIAACGTALSVPIVATLAARREPRWHTAVGALLVSLLAPISLLIGSARILPAAPMRLAEAALRIRTDDPASPGQDSRPGSPTSLLYANTIMAPRGLKDTLVHVWRKNGVIVDRIPVAIEGGGQKGFHTWTVKRRLGSSPAGDWSCSTETSSGQFLGMRSIKIDG